jgi:hypothetical protein
MKLKSKTVIFILVFATLFTAACLDDFNRYNDPVLYTPTYSIPIGPLNYSLEDIMPPGSLDFPIMDTSLIGDSIPLIIYNDTLFFENPKTGYDTMFTGPMDLSSISPNMEYTQSLMFRMNYSNEIPTDMGVQLYFYIGAQLVDSLFEDGAFLISQAIPEINGNNTIPYTGREDIYVDSTRIDNLLQVNNFLLSIHIDTYQEDQDIIHLYSRFGFDLQLAVRVNLLVPFE